MEIHFQQQQQPTKPLSKSKSKSKNAAVASNGGGASKFVGVRQRPSGRWVAEIKDTTHKIRMWLGTFETAEKAARAYDEAALLIRGANTRTNFSPSSPNRNSPLASRIRNLLRKKKITATPKQSTPVCGPTSSPVTTATSESSVVLQKDEDVYRPSCSNENNIDEFSWVFDSGIERLPLFDGAGDFELCNGVGGEEEMAEFDRMKVERQISASLYAINGVHEYLEAVRDASADPVWDLPPLCAQLYCTSNC